MSSAICLSWTTEDGGHTTEGRPCSILGQLSPVLRRVSRRDRLADVGKPVVLMTDRKQAAVGRVDARVGVEQVERARLQRHSGDVTVVLDHDAVDRGVEMDQEIVDRLGVAVTAVWI